MTFSKWLFRNPMNSWAWSPLDAIMHGSTWGLIVATLLLGLLYMVI